LRLGLYICRARRSITSSIPGADNNRAFVGFVVVYSTAKPSPVSLRIHLLHFAVSLLSLVFTLACGVVGFRGGGGVAEAEMRAQAWRSGHLFLQIYGEQKRIRGR
jgi:hypothetical protein